MEAMLPSCVLWSHSSIPFACSVLRPSASSPFSFSILPRTRSLNAARANQCLWQVCVDDGAENAVDEDPFHSPQATPLQTTASIVLTGSIAILLFRSFKRRSQRAKEERLRLSGFEPQRREAVEAAVSDASKSPVISKPNAGQTLLGAVMAGAIAAVLYKFTVAVEGSFADKSMSSNYSIRQITVTIRTIVNGLLYLATFVFAANSIGLFLYSLQLALSSVPFPGSISDSKPVNVKEGSDFLMEAEDVENNDNNKA